MLNSIKLFELPLEAPKSPTVFNIVPCYWSKISWMFRDNHYKADHIGGDITICFSLEYNGDVWGAAAYGPPRHNNYSDNGRYRVIDLRRLACRDEAPKYTESYFLGKMIKYLKRHKLADAILTYADETQGHTGIIYKASNFEYVGKTAPSKHIVWNGKQYHMRSLTIDRPYSTRLNEAVKNGEADVVNGLPKHIFMYWLIKHT